MTAELVHALHQAGLADVRDDATTRAAYSTDASLYRVPPQVVAFPKSTDDLLAAYDVARRLGVPVTARGAGTSVAGNAVGTGLVIETSRYLNRVLEIDPEARTARVEPGAVQAVLQKAAAPYGLRFGPDPSTSTRCTIGGMIANNACGSRSLQYGRTSDNVLDVSGVWGTGTGFSTGRSGDSGSPEARALRDLASSRLGPIRTSFGRFKRQVSGYSMEHLLPEHGADVAGFLAGTEGTLGLLTEATVRLVGDPAERVVVVLSYPDLASAGDAAPAVVAYGPTSCEGLDARLVDVVRLRLGDAAVPELPRGAGWLLVEVSGDDLGEVRSRAARMASDSSLGFVESRVVEPAAEQAALWRIRADGAGLAGRAPSGRPAHAGWEDAAVPPASLGAYIREFDALTDEFGLTSSPFGHFGDGCIHVRLDFPMQRPDGPEVLRTFMEQAADLVVRHGGSLSGEHGDGRARSALLDRMYDADALALFAAAKHSCDPDNLLNPGVITDPRPLEADLRFPVPLLSRAPGGYAWLADDGDLAQAVHRCTGVGKCRADNSATGVMCPSYRATREEKDSTRGRARVLQEMMNGAVVKGGWRAPEVQEALDLCLSCKGCASDCPTGIDMASYKSEALYQAYRHRPRPLSHYSLGNLPRWVRLAARGRLTTRMTNALFGVGDKFSAAKRLAGVDPRRSIPPLAPESFRHWAVREGLTTMTGAPGEVVLWADTFSDYFSPEVAEAAVSVLRKAGATPVLAPDGLCCGLTWISTGQLGTARRMLTETVTALDVAASAGIPIVGLEPSCTTVLRHDAVELLCESASDESELAAAARRVAAATRTLAEHLMASGWTPPRLDGVEIVAQPHCHHSSILGWTADQALLEAAGAKVTKVGGCCGLAGNFGVESGHYEVSVAVAELDLFPAVRASSPDAVILADGFSCRTQLNDLDGAGGRDVMHLAQLLNLPK